MDVIEVPQIQPPYNQNMTSLSPLEIKDHYRKAKIHPKRTAKPATPTAAAARKSCLYPYVITSRKSFNCDTSIKHVLHIPKL